VLLLLPCVRSPPPTMLGEPEPIQQWASPQSGFRLRAPDRPVPRSRVRRRAFAGCHTVWTHVKATVSVPSLTAGVPDMEECTRHTFRDPQRAVGHLPE